MSAKRRKPKFRVGQVVFDRWQGYCGYAQVTSVKDSPLIGVVDRGGNHWSVLERYLRRLTKKERGE